MFSLLLKDLISDFDFNKVVKDVLETLNIDHVLTSVYHPQSNAKVERFHRTLHDVLAKRLADDEKELGTFISVKQLRQLGLMSVSLQNTHHFTCGTTGMWCCLLIIC